MKSYPLFFRTTSLRAAVLSAFLSTNPVWAAENIDSDQFFQAQDLAGAQIDLKQLLSERKAVLINFWATWCALCKEEIPALAQLQSARAEDGLAIVGVNVAESGRKVRRYVEDMGINYPVVLDPESAIAESYNVMGLPVCLLVRADGSVTGPYSGFTEELQADVGKALAP
jgi:thiol-disulfide isomerase/thioredoxin